MYNNARGVECYERTRSAGRPERSLVPRSRPASPIRSSDKGTADHVPIVSIATAAPTPPIGRRVSVGLSAQSPHYWSQNTAKIKFIGMKEGGMEKLKGKKIVNIYHDSAYGKETIPVLDAQPRSIGFQVMHIPVAPPGQPSQQAQWLQIRQIKPDLVILRGWGV